MLFMLKAGKALYAWIHDPSLFDCAIEHYYCTLSKDEICREKKNLWVLHVSQLHTSYKFILLYGESVSWKPQSWNVFIQGEDMEILYSLSPSLKYSVQTPLSGGKAC